jgi:cytochrome c oxidase subunit II
MRRRLVRWLPLSVLLLVASGCSHTKQDVFHPEGRTADRINTLQVPVFIAAGVVGVIVAVMLTYAMVTGRRRHLDADEGDPPQVHGNYALEITWTIVPFVILLLVAIFTVSTLVTISHKPKDALRVDVYGQQWWWSYEYDTNNDGTPDIITANELVVPVGQSVDLEIHSRDVIHSFWIPALAGTRDAVPGRVQPLQIRADKIGEFDGQCKEFCGLSHANMRARAVVLSAEDFQTWLSDQQQDASTPSSGTDAAAGETIYSQKCATCHQINGAKTADGTAIDIEGKAALVAGHAPNLTHLMSRDVFASAQFALWLPNADGKLEFNRNQLEAWLRDPPALLPMAPDERRGMPNLNLSEDEIDKLVAYLETLGPYPENAIPPSTTTGG